jgi:hypothetical protein
MGTGCAPKCAGATPYCNGTNHCVGCLGDANCQNGFICKVVSDTQAACVLGCADDSRCGAGKKCCGGRCVDPNTDAANCGSCGKSCAVPHGEAACSAMKCTFSGKCDPGWGNCGKDPTEGCPINLRLDANNCAKCGTKCSFPHALPACANGCYMAACDFGWDHCSMEDKDGCETSVLSDSDNCGACSKSCDKLPHASAACANAKCVLGMCDPGYFDCDGNPDNGCEAFIEGDKMNCGKCGTVCAGGTPYCVKGACSDVDPGVKFEEMFTQNQPSPAQCIKWNTFRGLLKGTYSSIVIKGSKDMVGVKCEGAQADQICQALKKWQLGQPTQTINCGGKAWAIGACGNGAELTATGGVCACNDGPTVRPCIGNDNWGSIKGQTCTAPTQTMIVICQ